MTKGRAAISHLILHIGLHKTGTSSLQQFAARNRDVLASKGVIYPGFHDQGYPDGVLAHHGLTLGLARHFPEFALKNGPDAAWEALIEAYASTDQTVFVSSEEFSRGRQGFRVDMARLGEIARAFDRVTVQCVLREQIGFLQSVFYENSRDGRAITPEWLIRNAMTRNDAAGVWVDWRPLWDHLLTGFDPADIRLLDYDVIRRAEGGVVGTLFEPTGLTARPGGSMSNTSPRSGVYAICQSLCAGTPVPPDMLARVDAEFTRLFGPDQKGSLFTRAQAAQIQAHFEPLNADLVRRVRSHHPDFAFSCPPPSGAVVYRDEMPRALFNFARSQVAGVKSLPQRQAAAPNREIGKVGLIAAFKNEGPWVLEWVAHHLGLGFDEIGVATNDCEDSTDHILARLAELGYVVHLDQTGNTGHSPQGSAYRKLRQHPRLRGCDWLMTLDGNELLNPKTPSVQSFLSKQVGTDVVAMSWRVFGDSGQSGFPIGTMAQTYTCAAVPNHDCNALFKCLIFLPQRFEAINYHLPSRLRQPGALVMSLDGTRFDIPPSDQPLRSFLDTERRTQGLGRDYRAAQINHYATKTRDIFDFKAARGRGVHLKGTRHSAILFAHMNRNEVEDTSISAHQGHTQVYLSQFLADPVLAKLHAQSCALWKARIQGGHKTLI